MNKIYIDFYTESYSPTQKLANILSNNLSLVILGVIIKLVKQYRFILLSDWNSSS